MLKTSCVLASVHEKFNQAYILWEQAYKSYFIPDTFITNFNATIQALRNITFTLQNKQSLFRDFNTWYQPWKDSFKKDEYMRWLCDARTKIVHQDDFNVNSYATVRVFNYATTYLSDCAIPINTPIDAVVGWLLDNKRVSKQQVNAENIIEINRRWSVQEFKSEDILYVLLCTFPIYSNMIASAHQELEASILDCEFYVKENKSGFPQKLIALIDDYPNEHFQQYSLKDLQPIKFSASVETKARHGRDEVLKHYYPDNAMIKADSWIDSVIDVAKRIVERDKFHAPIALLENSQGKRFIINLELKTRAHKYIAYAKLAEYAQREKVRRAILVNESYIISSDECGKFFESFNTNELEHKQDCLLIYDISPSATTEYLIPFCKKEDATIVFGNMVVNNDANPNIFSKLVLAIKNNQ